MVSWQADAPDGQRSTGLGPVGVGMMNNAGHQRKKLLNFRRKHLKNAGLCRCDSRITWYTFRSSEEAQGAEASPK
jgi:hypothetical protein